MVNILYALIPAKIAYQLENKNYLGITEVSYPRRTYASRRPGDLMPDGSEPREGDIIRDKCRFPNRKWPVRKAIERESKKYDPKAVVTSLALVAQKGAQIFDHFAEANRTGKDELRFPGTVNGNPGNLLGLDGYHGFGKSSCEQLEMVRLLRKARDLWHDDPAALVEWENEIKDTRDEKLLELSLIHI